MNLGRSLVSHRFAFVVALALSEAGCGHDELVKPAGSESGDTNVPNECGIRSGYPGDDQCLLPPPPDKGFQVHVGPSDYENPEPEYVLEPGEEISTQFAAVSGNSADVYFFNRQYRMRPSAHHVNLSTLNGSDVAAGRRIGTANAPQDFPAGGVIAPEDRAVGLPLSARSPINVDFHAINTSSRPVLREVWVNFWYRDPGQVTEIANEWLVAGSVAFQIQPREATTLGPYTCIVEGDGRMLWLYGHRHANNVRFTVWRARGSQRDVIYDAYDWADPLLLEYSSLVKNPAPDPARGIEGGWSGILDLKAGDRIEWACDVVNQNDVVIGFTNQAYRGEMCVVAAEAVGATCREIEP